MTRYPHIGFTIILLFSIFECIAQENARIPAPEVKLLDNSLQITYEILNTSPTDKFEIELIIKDGDGNTLPTRTLRGDVGKGVSGGGRKVIYWDLETDQVAMNSEILVNILADPMVSQNKPGEEKPSGNASAMKMNRTSLMLQSAVFPGLGLSRYTGKPHWIKGVMAYGCIGGAIALNRSAVSNYEKFISSETTEDANAYFDKSSSQDQMSEILAFSAIGIWVADLVWTFLGTNSGKTGVGLEFRNGIYLSPGLDSRSGAPVLALKYRF